jgi:type II restriction/modification system DNA methylase subunit YeeA
LASSLHLITDRYFALVCVLTATDGLDIVRNLDYIVRTAYVNGEHFQKHLIPTLAEKYSNKFSAILAPLFVDDDSAIDENSFHHWGQSTKDWQYRRKMYIYKFTEILKLKAETVLIGELYQLLWVRIQPRIDSEITQVDMKFMPTEES